MKSTLGGYELRKSQKEQAQEVLRKAKQQELEKQQNESK